MSSTGPPVLPISTVQSTESQPPISVSAFRAFLSRLNDSFRNGISQRRPWPELTDRSAFSKPESFSEATLRIRKNYSYFRVNYLMPLVIFGRTFSDRETLGILIILSVFVIFLTSVGSLLISAIMVGFGLVCAHGAFRAPEDLFLDEQEPANTGFLSFLGGAASNAAAAAVPAVSATRI
ncbi:hypothetical protein GOBAR_DD31767 [Gossypium barbadense]|nr:hypothetical protein GOBAR_DD31766 [Gossypium barbadense]PPD71356.1 hypothetical protein GOBAR_DD31767 [Gossypium barbadense]